MNQKNATSMHIDLLYFTTCPSWQTALENLHAALAAEGLTATVRLLQIENQQEAEQHRFAGSPSLRVNGQDWWRTDSTEYAMQCRMYATAGGLVNAPTVEMLRERFLDMRAQAIAFVRRRADHFDEVIVHDSLYDSYSIRYNEDAFWLVNFSPREGALYSQTPIALDSAVDYLEKVGFAYSF